VGTEVKWWLVSGDCTITGPSGFNRAATLMERIKYNPITGVLTSDMPSIQPLQNSFDANLVTTDKSFVGALNELVTASGGGAYLVGDLFTSARTYPSEEAIPLGSAPVPITDYPELHGVIGNRYGDGGSLAKNWPQYTPSIDFRSAGYCKTVPINTTAWVVLIAGGGTTTSTLLYNRDTKEVIEVPKGTNQAVTAGAAVDGKPQYYTIGATGEILHNTFNPTTKTIVKTPVITLTASSIRGFWWVGDSNNIGDGYLLINDTTVGLVRYTVQTYTTITATIIRASWHGFPAGGVIGAGTLKDKNLYISSWQGTYSKLEVLAWPYNVATTVVSPVLYSEPIKCRSLEWSPTERCFYMGIKVISNNDIKLLRVSETFEVLETLSFDKLLPAYFIPSTSSYLDSINHIPTDGGIALGFTFSNKPVTFHFKSYHPVVETFGVPEHSGSGGVSEAGVKTELEVPQVYRRYYRDSRYETANYGGISISDGILYWTGYNQSTQMIAASLNLTTMAFAAYSTYSVMYDSYNGMGTLYVSTAAFYKTVAINSSTGLTQSYHLLTERVSGVSITGSNLWRAAYLCKRTNNIYLFAATYCNQITPEGVITKVWDFTDNPWAYYFRHFVVDYMTGRLILACRTSLYIYNKGATTVSAIIPIKPSLANKYSSICQNPNSGEILVHYFDGVYKLEDDNTMTYLGGTVGVEWSGIAVDSDTDDIWIIGDGISKFTKFSIDVTYPLIEYIKA
jgi:hypothetical protein